MRFVLLCVLCWTSEAALLFMAPPTDESYASSETQFYMTLFCPDTWVYSYSKVSDEGKECIDRNVVKGFNLIRKLYINGESLPCSEFKGVNGFVLAVNNTMNNLPEDFRGFFILRTLAVIESIEKDEKEVAEDAIHAFIAHLLRFIHGLREEDQKKLVSLFPKLRVFIRGTNAEKLQLYLADNLESGDLGEHVFKPRNFLGQGASLLYNAYFIYAEENWSELRKVGLVKGNSLHPFSGLHADGLHPF